METLNTATRNLESNPAYAPHDAYREQAYRVLKGSVAEAFQFDHEDAIASRSSEVATVPEHPGGHASSH